MANYVGNIKVNYGDKDTQRPANYMREFAPGTGDINKGFKGQFVWLTTVGVSNQNPVASGIQLVRQRSANPTLDDIAAGTGGDFRYLVPTHGDQKIRDLVLYRSAKKLEGVPQGYKGHTEDLNSGRGGEFLYILWKADAM